MMPSMASNLEALLLFFFTGGHEMVAAGGTGGHEMVAAGGTGGHEMVAAGGTCTSCCWYMYIFGFVA